MRAPSGLSPYGFGTEVAYCRRCCLRAEWWRRFEAPYSAARQIPETTEQWPCLGELSTDERSSPTGERWQLFASYWFRLVSLIFVFNVKIRENE